MLRVRLPRSLRAKLFAVGVLLAAAALIPVLPVLALTYGSGLYGACQYDSCSITIGSTGAVSVNVTPSSSGSCSTQSDAVSVFTDDPSGFTLSLAGSSTNTALQNGGASIASSSGSQASPAALSANQWGYRVDGVGGFGAGPTSAQTNVGLNSTLFAGVPSSSSPADTLADTNVSADPAVSTNVWYGVCVNTSIASGTYASQVTYTAITN